MIFLCYTDIKTVQDATGMYNRINYSNVDSVAIYGLNDTALEDASGSAYVNKHCNISLRINIPEFWCLPTDGCHSDKAQPGAEVANFCTSS